MPTTPEPPAGLVVWRLRRWLQPSEWAGGCRLKVHGWFAAATPDAEPQPLWVDLDGAPLEDDTCALAQPPEWFQLRGHLACDRLRADQQPGASAAVAEAVRELLRQHLERWSRHCARHEPRYNVLCDIVAESEVGPALVDRNPTLAALLSRHYRFRTTAGEQSVEQLQARGGEVAYTLALSPQDYEWQRSIAPGTCLYIDCREALPRSLFVRLAGLLGLTPRAVDAPPNLPHSVAAGPGTEEWELEEFLRRGLSPPGPGTAVRVVSAQAWPHVARLHPTVEPVSEDRSAEAQTRWVDSAALVLRADSELASGLRRMVRRHAETCPACRPVGPGGECTARLAADLVYTNAMLFTLGHFTSTWETQTWVRVAQRVVHYEQVLEDLHQARADLERADLEVNGNRPARSPAARPSRPGTRARIAALRRQIEELTAELKRARDDADELRRSLGVIPLGLRA
ncbi:MAG: zf-HC2 domain-containing protein [Armatimonadetes bacterium]|nr:zf-HC2 domain-containing protein [Armatimonadota bacterium]